MKVIEENQDQIDIKTKKTMRIIVIAIVTLLAISIILFITIYNLQQQLFKFNIDGKSQLMRSSDLFIHDGDTIYVSLYDIAESINYKYYRGGYKEYTEDTNKCYLECNNEISIFEEGENIIYKTAKDGIDYEYFTIDKPIKIINNKLYITSKGIETACNLKFTYDVDTNTTTIYTLPYYLDYYTKNNKYSAASKNFNNQKALLYGLMVTQNVENTERNQSKSIYYGISSLDNKEIVGKKYTDINFIESTKEFIVKTAENKVGIITSEGDTKLTPQYDSIKQIDQNLNLYLVEIKNKQGVIEKNGKILVYPEYDRIGIDSNSFQGNNLKNPYLLFNNAIPVQKNGKWGMYDKKGNLILKLEYDGMGCTANSSKSNNIIIIPSLKTIVVAKDYEEQGQNKKKNTFYGLVNYLGREIVPAGLQKIYATVRDGRTEYYMEFNGTTYDVITKIREIVPKLDELNDESKVNKTTEEIKNS